MFCFSFLPSRMRYSPRDGRCPQKNETYFWRGFGPNRNERNGEIISGWNEKERRNSVAIDVWPGTDTTVHDFHSATTRALRDKVGTIIEFLDERSSRLSLCSLLSSPVGRNGNKRKSCIYLFPYVCVFFFLSSFWIRDEKVKWWILPKWFPRRLSRVSLSLPKGTRTNRLPFRWKSGGWVFRTTLPPLSDTEQVRV